MGEYTVPCWGRAAARHSAMQTDTLNSPMRLGAKQTSSPAIVIVADDLTGACDSAVAFVASGRPVRVMLNQPRMDSPIEFFEGDGSVLSCTTETRNLSETQATSRVAEAMAALANAQPNAVFFKKVDSAARGHFGAEIMAAVQATGVNLALVAPAFPQAERTVHSGILSVQDCSGQDSRIALRDHFAGLDSQLIEILHTGSETALRLGIRRAIANGIKILLCDSDTQEDLERLAVAGSELRQSLLWVGSAGMARALASTQAVPARKSTPQSPILRGRTLLFTGSPHPVTRLQLSRVEKRALGPDQAVFQVEFSPTSQREIRDAFTAIPVAALILTGGDTAAFVLKALDASSICLAGELALGVPWGFISGGMADGCRVITKSGGFGDRDTLVHALEFCARRSS
jgi:uncharacterized protein YgbK (DUF1537 family)